MIAKFVAKLLLFLIILALLANALFVWFFRPLVPTWRWRVKAETSSGIPLFVKTYKWLGFNQGAFYIQIKSKDGTPLYISPPEWTKPEELTERWFKVLFTKDKALVNDTYANTYPYLCKILPDILFGQDECNNILVYRGGIENWGLSRNDKSLIFSNALITVSVTKK